MKNIFKLLLLAVLSIWMHPIIAQPIGQPKTTVKALGGLSSDSSLLPPYYVDTNAVKSTWKKGGSIIRTKIGSDTVLAEYTGSAWTILGSSSSGITPNLQQVTDVGGVTTDTISAGDYRFNGMTYSQLRAAALYAYKDSVKVATGIVKPKVEADNSMSWSIVKWDDPTYTTYDAIRLDSVYYSTDRYLYIYFKDTAKRIVKCDVTVDDDFAKSGVIAGASIFLDHIRITYAWDKGNHGGIMYRDGTGWHYSYALEATSVTEIGTNGIEWAETTDSQQGGTLAPSYDYLGFLSGGYEVKYLGSKGYTLKHATGLPPTKRHYLIDAYGNDVPLTSLDATDIFQVTSNRSIRHYNPGNSNNWRGASNSAAFFVTLIYE